MMVQSAALKAMSRAEKGKGVARKLRAAGRIPAVLYGEGEGARSLSVDAHELYRLFAGISVDNTVIELGIDEAAAIRVLVRETQKHPYRDDILHVDFYQVRAGETVTVEIPVLVIGTPEGVREGGVLDQTTHELAVRCVVDRIPESIEVDISALAIGDTIHVRDLILPAGVESEVEGDRVICSVTPPTVPALEEESEEPEGPETSPELIRPHGTDEE
jgi:large subunit ribosomal protein L25